MQKHIIHINQDSWNALSKNLNVVYENSEHYPTRLKGDCTDITFRNHHPDFTYLH